ncbi:phosphoribosylglycinamide formyltransferase [Schlesneria paludicola]|uniref:phosphoribosylglycinamide formyltransferase n=1 Tax=Schlesneria paludicola TaxID=360056 RepID=UPI00029AF75F|nr:phosphoribosylglycinamide formyltransferase [Schlesneria paludicola]
MARFRPLSAPLERPIRLAVLISGGGTTLMNLMAKIRQGELSAEIRVVLASRAECAGVKRAQELGLPCHVIARKTFESVADFSHAIFSQCRANEVDLVVCGGFLSLMTVPDDFLGRVINTHPALIPVFCGKGFYGHHVHEAVIARGVRISGCTIHFADNEYDHGPIIEQRAVPVLDSDTPDDLAARVFASECEALPEAIRRFASGQLEIDGSRVRTIQ